MNSVLLRETIKRDIEKQMIREEILAEEAIQRRKIEEEVRRELALERELALSSGGGGGGGHGFWSTLLPGREPRLSMLDRQDRLAMTEWIPRPYDRFHIPPVGFGLPEFVPHWVGAEYESSDRVPFQRHPAAWKSAEVGPSDKLLFQRSHETSRLAEVNKPQAGKLLVLPKPLTATLTGIKRKATSDVNTPKEKCKKWKCNLCGVRTTGEHDFNMHLEGKKHKENEAASAKKIKTPTPKKDEKDKASRDLSQFWCPHCKIQCTGGKDLTRHLNGKKHLARMMQLKRTGGTASVSKDKQMEELKQTADSASSSKIMPREDLKPTGSTTSSGNVPVITLIVKKKISSEDESGVQEKTETE